MIRRLSLISCALFLAATGVLGIYDGSGSLQDSTTPFQMVVGIAIIMYGVVAIVALAGLLMRRSWSVPATIAWGVLITFVASTAALAYAGEPASLVGAIASGAVSALIAWLVLAGVRTRLNTKTAV